MRWLTALVVGFVFIAIAVGTAATLAGSLLWLAGTEVGRLIALVGTVVLMSLFIGSILLSEAPGRKP